MPELTAKDAKLIQYLNEAYGKERKVETALQAHITLTTRDAYRKRLKDHLKETKQQATGLKRRIKELGGKAETGRHPDRTWWPRRRAPSRAPLRRPWLPRRDRYTPFAG